MTIFHHLFTDIEKLSIVTPFEPNKFPSISWPRITLRIGGQRRRKIFSQSISDQMPAGMQILKKMEFQKLFKLTPSRNMSKQKQSENDGKGTPKKKCRRKMNWKETQRKNELKWKWRETRKEDQRELVPHTVKNDPWSYHLETQFGPTYLFFRNPEPRPTLRTIKVYFDWTWIPRLKRFFLKEFSSKIVLIN